MRPIAAAAAVLLLCASCNDEPLPNEEEGPRSCAFDLQFPYGEYAILLTGDTGRLTPVGLTSLATRVEWSSSDPTVARVDSTGLVTGLQRGYSEISADGCTGFVVEVVARPVTLELLPDTLRMLPGNQGLLGYEFRDEFRATVDHWFVRTLVTLVSDAAAVATVSPDPNYPTVFGVADGTATVSAAFGELSDTMTVIVAATTLAAPDVGVSHSCAISTDSLPYCWGNTLWVYQAPVEPGRLSGPAPVAVASSTSWVSLASGSYHLCGITVGGALYCTGSNQFGQLGVEGAPLGPAPVPGHLFVSVSAGAQHTCAMTTEGEAYCWGVDVAGELGVAIADGCWLTFSAKDSPTPVGCSRTPLEVGQGLGLTSVRAGSALTCGRTSTGATYCWGVHYGPDPALVDDRLGLDSIDLGGVWQAEIADAMEPLACGLDPAGEAYCWGKSRFGLGDGSTTESWTPVPVSGGLTFRALSVGYGVCGLTTQGAIYCWGGAPSGFAAGATPIPVPGGLTFTTVSAGASHGCGQATDERVYCWGANSETQLGVSGPDRAIPVRALGQR